MLNSDSAKEKETAHQQDTEEQVMMAWETLDDIRQRKKIKMPMRQNLKMMNLIFGREVEVPGDFAGRASLSENVA